MQENGLMQPNGVQQQPKVVGPNVKGKREEYQLIRRLQSALFGGVYEARGRSSGRDFAIKVLHKSELTKAQECNSIEFCEAPLSEIRFAELMKGDEHVMEAEEHFEDQYCWYVVFELARGGDLLEALKQKPRGFDEAHAQYLIRQAAKGLAFLHRRRVAMQDVSLENMLLHVNEQTGHYQVKVCDPGQAVVFEVDNHGEEKLVNFRGLVGKSFRPPELHDQEPYVATKVDSWCLGWSTFYLLTAQPLFMSADPAQQDADWLLFQQGDFTTLFQQKSNLCSATGLDFIFRLLQMEPNRRMSVTDSLNHPWLADPTIAPVMAAEELLPESLRKSKVWDQETTPVKDTESMGQSPSSKTVTGATAAPGNGSANLSLTGVSTGGTIAWSGSAGNVLPTWNAATTNYNGSGQSPMLRVRSPPRSPRLSGTTNLAPRMPTDRRRPKAVGPGRAAYVIATAHSPPPGVAPAYQTVPQRTSATRTASPIQAQMLQSAMIRAPSPPQYISGGSSLDAQSFYRDARPAFLTPRSSSRASAGPSKPESTEMDSSLRGRAWAFRGDGSDATTRMGSGETRVTKDTPGSVRASSPIHAAIPTLVPARVPSPAPMPAGWAQVGRAAQSPPRGQAIHFPRSLSPIPVQGATMRTASPGVGATLRTASPGMVVTRASEGIGFSWSQAPPTFSPRTASPVAMAFPRQASPVGASTTLKAGFAWSPEPPSPRASPRTYSPGPTRITQATR